MGFQKATKVSSYLRLALAGPAKSGKSYTSLRIATTLAKWRGTRIAAIDTERGSLSKYSDEFDFDTDDQLPSFKPTEYIKRINEAVRDGYRVLIIDSLSHAWEGAGGVLDQADRKGNRFDVWKDLTPQQRELVETILQAECDVIVTMRTKTAWDYEKNDRGKLEPRRIGLAPVQRQGIEYEFDAVVDMDTEHVGTVAGTRCRALDGAAIRFPGDEIALPLIAWLGGGSPDERALAVPSNRVRATPADAPELSADRGRVRDPQRGLPPATQHIGQVIGPVRSGPALVVEQFARGGETPPAPGVVVRDMGTIPAAVRAYYDALSSLRDPAEGGPLWLAHRDALKALGAAHGVEAWEALCARAGELGQRNTDVWLRRQVEAIERENALRAAETAVTSEHAETKRKALDWLASGPDARALVAWAKNVIGLPAAIRADVGAAYRDRWVALLIGAAWTPAQRKQIVRAVGQLPPGVWELADWTRFRSLLAGDEKPDEPTAEAPTPAETAMVAETAAVLADDAASAFMSGALSPEAYSGDGREPGSDDADGDDVSGAALGAPDEDPPLDY